MESSELDMLLKELEGYRQGILILERKLLDNAAALSHDEVWVYSNTEEILSAIDNLKTGVERRLVADSNRRKPRTIVTQDDK